MRIDRLEVSGGFLDGLRLDLAAGLNVLIGARGAGKTSVLELLRYALGVRAMTDDAERAANEQARAVLGDGTVTVFASVQGEQVRFHRTGLDDTPSSSAQYSYVPPLIVSQNEIEAIGLDPVSRREIVDRLVDPLAWTDVGGLGETRAQVASLERRLERLRRQREELVDQVARLDDVPQRLAAAEAEQASAAEQVEAAKPLQEAIAARSDELGRVRAAADAYRIAEDALTAWAQEISRSRLERPIPALPSPDLRDRVADGVSTANQHLQGAVAEIELVKNLVAEQRAKTRGRQGDMQSALKEDAEKLEELQRGAGEIGRRVSTLRQQLQERQGLQERLGELQQEIVAVAAERNAALDAADERSNVRFQLRQQRAAQLTQEFNGRIEVRVDKSGEYGAYEAALVRALQGSNLQYRPLAASISRRMSPRELVSAVEAGDPDRIVSATQISRDRALRLVGHLQPGSLVDLLLAPLDDAVDFALLDGQEFKSTHNLSMGQRCTVVLPLLLAEDRESVLLDQPEDHLDNAFIVETLVEAIRERARAGQVLVATHNANIPVLGEADQVIVLDSDGRRGFVSACAPLDDDSAVNAITTLMEGGREAFARRAAFYSTHEVGD